MFSAIDTGISLTFSLLLPFPFHQRNPNSSPLELGRPGGWLGPMGGSERMPSVLWARVRTEELGLQLRPRGQRSWAAPVVPTPQVRPLEASLPQTLSGYPVSSTWRETGAHLSCRIVS